MIRRGANEVYDLVDRAEQIYKAFVDPEPEVYPKAARVIQKLCPEDAADLLEMCGLTPEGIPV
jgi:hypothetical protein